MKRKNTTPRTHQKGFTLIETLVAIFVLMLAIVTPMSIASRALSSANYAKDQVIAFYLAQEGVELVRSIRDNNALDSGGGQWNAGDLGNPNSGTICYSSSGCQIDPKDLSVEWCSGGCSPLYINENGVYSYDEGGTATPFSRIIEIEEVDNNGGGEEIRISSTVVWQSHVSGQVRSFTITNNLLNWQ